MSNLKSKSYTEILIEGAISNKLDLVVTFYPPYDEKRHSNFPDALKDALKQSKKEIFNIMSDYIDIIILLKSKDVKSIKWV